MRDQRAIEGKNVNVKAYYQNGWYPFACATSIEFTSDFEEVERTGPNSGSFKEFELRLGEWGFTLESITHIVPPPGIGSFLTVFTALMESVRREGLPLELSFVDPVGNVKTITGTALIPSVKTSSDATGFSQDTIVFKGTGPFRIGSALSNNSIMAYDVLDGDFTGVAGEASVTISALIGCQLLGVFRGYPLDRVPYTSNAPALLEHQVAYAVDVDGRLTTGVLDFGYEFGPGEFIYYFYKKY